MKNRPVTYNYQGTEYTVFDVNEEPKFLRLILKTLTGENYLVISVKK